MKFFEIELMSAPEIRFACSVDIEKNKNRFDYIDCFLELCVIEQGNSMHKNFDGTVDIMEPGMLSVITSSSGCECISVENQRQRHTTVGVNVAHKPFMHNSEAVCDISALKERMKNGTTVLVPYQEPLGDIYHKVINIIRNISYLHLNGNPSDNMRALGQWYTLVGMLTEFVLEKLDNIDVTPSETVYVEKAVRYINSHYSEKITVGDIASYLQISDGHLHRIFKNIKGTTIVAYINQLRVTAAMSLMENRHLSLKEAACNVGIDDPAYMSRLFKNVTGMSLREYLRQKGETVNKIE